MGFIINDTIYFNKRDFSLKNITTSDVIYLPASAGCIFLILLQNHGGTVERESILDSSWVDFGLSISNNTLNQYISLLRKSLLRIGVEENIIITVPRVGFYLSDKFKIEKVGINDVILPHRKKNTSYYYFITVFILVISIELFFVFYHREPDLHYEFVKGGNISNCEIYFSKNISQGYKKDAIQMARDISKKYLPCKDDSVFIFDAQGGIILQKDGRAFLSRCDKNESKGTLIGCSEVLIYEKI